MESLDKYEKAFRSIGIKYLVVGYIIHGSGEMEYISVACMSDEARDRNVKKFDGKARVFELKETNVNNG